LDLGTVPVWLEAEAPRVNCREHGPTVRAVPWARHAAVRLRIGRVMAEHKKLSEAIEDYERHRRAVTELMRVAWRTVGAIIARVWDDVDAVHPQERDVRASTLRCMVRRCEGEAHDAREGRPVVLRAGRDAM
jgi:hypothetical protein